MNDFALKIYADARGLTADATDVKQYWLGRACRPSQQARVFGGYDENS